jgi:cation diffusion facilitator CzcD-associated flavoprotein CzcO
MPSPTTEGGPQGGDETARLDAVIIGAGFAGLAMGRQLKQAGIERFVILDRAEGVGGVWRANTYPGAACDVPSHLYSYSFFLNPDWSRKYSPQSEILAYLERAADAFGLRPHLDFNQAVTALTFHAGDGVWTITLASGRTIEARVVISAVGQLAEPAWPEIKDRQVFEGPMIHSAHWKADVDLSGKRVAVIGNAASAIQLLPEMADKASQLTIFQRTPNWVIDKPDRRFTRVEQWLFRKLPWWRRLYRRISFLIHESRYSAFVKNSIASDWTRWRLKQRLNRHVKDPALRDMLTPDYPPGCKRILLSNDYFDVVQRPHVRLVARRAARLERDAILTPDGERIGVDAIVCATGFKATDFLAGIDVTGPDGRTLREVWGESPKAYRGVAVSGFPNLFMLYGPNTNLGHNSIIFMLERQTEYVRKQIERLFGEGLSSLEVKEEAQAAFNTALQKKLKRTVWAADCPSWYKTADGVITNNWHGHALEFAQTLGKADDDAWIAYR